MVTEPGMFCLYETDYNLLNLPEFEPVNIYSKSTTSLRSLDFIPEKLNQNPFW